MGAEIILGVPFSGLASVNTITTLWFFITRIEETKSAPTGTESESALARTKKRETGIYQEINWKIECFITLVGRHLIEVRGISPNYTKKSHV